MATENLTRDEDVLTLVLRGDDYLHFVELLDAARDSLPGSTDSLRSRATLRAAFEFLEENEYSCTPEFLAGLQGRYGSLNCPSSCRQPAGASSDASYAAEAHTDEAGAPAGTCDAFLTPERVDMALHACWDIEPCVERAMKALREEVDEVEKEAVTLALLRRAKELNDVIMAALNDPNDPIESLRSRLRGEA